MIIGNVDFVGENWQKESLDILCLNRALNDVVEEVWVKSTYFKKIARANTFKWKTKPCFLWQQGETYV